MEVRVNLGLLSRTCPLRAATGSTKLGQKGSKSLIPEYFTGKSLFLKDPAPDGL